MKKHLLLFWLIGSLVLAAGLWAANPYYDHGTFPQPGSLGSSAAMRAELDLIEAGFAKLPTLSGNANKAVVINGGANAISTTTGTLTLPGNFALSGSNSVTLTTTGTTNVTLPTSGILATTANAIPKGSAFPGSPTTYDLFFLTSDGAVGTCAASAGSFTTLCWWNGSVWGPVNNFIVASATLQSAYDQTSGNIISGVDEGKPIQIRGSGGQSTSGADFAQLSSGSFQWVCVVANVQNACDYIRKLGATHKYEIQNNSGTPILTVSNDTGAVSNLTVDGEGSGNNIKLYYKLCGGDLAAINPADSAAYNVWNKDPLSTAPTLTARSGTNRGSAVLTFPDSDGDYGVQMTCDLPPGFTGNIDAVIWWDTTGTGNARFQFQTKCYADDEADDASFNTASVVTAAAGTSGRPNRQTISSITITGCDPNELMRVRFFRNRTEASDSLSAALTVERVGLWVRNTF